MSRMIFNALVIGSGNVGAFYDEPSSTHCLTHAHAFTKHDGFHLVGFVDDDLEKARRAGYDALSLSVAKTSPAVSLYERYGFRRVDESADALTMVAKL